MGRKNVTMTIGYDGRIQEGEPLIGWYFYEIMKTHLAGGVKDKGAVLVVLDSIHGLPEPEKPEPISDPEEEFFGH